MAITIDQYGVYVFVDSGTQVVVAPGDFTNQGDYSGSATYARHDVSTYLGALYICLSPNTGIAPSGNVSAYWSTLVLLESGTPPEVDCCAVGSNALTLAQQAYDLAVAGGGTLAEEAYILAVAGTTLAQQAYDLAVAGGGTLAADAFILAGAAYSLAAIGTDVGTNAYNLAQTASITANGAFDISVVGTEQAELAYGVATDAYSLAAIGTDVGTNAYNLAQTAFSVAQAGSVSFIGNNYRFGDGFFGLLNLSTGSYHPVYFYGTGTEITLVWDAGTA